MENDFIISLWSEISYLNYEHGEPWRNRTSNLLIKSQLLCLIELTAHLARPARLERATCGFEVRRSIHLSYGRSKGE